MSRFMILRCILSRSKVVQSDDPSYPVGGYDIVCSESELRRGAPVRLAFIYDEVFDQHDQGAIRA